MFKTIENPFNNCCSTPPSLLVCKWLNRSSLHMSPLLRRLLQFRHANGMRRNNYCRICLRGALMGPKLSTQTTKKRKGMSERQKNRKRESVRQNRGVRPTLISGESWLDHSARYSTSMKHTLLRPAVTRPFAYCFDLCGRKCHEDGDDVWRQKRRVAMELRWR